MLQSLTRTGVAMLSCCVLACAQDSSDERGQAEADVGSGGTTEFTSTSGGVHGTATGAADGEGDPMISTTGPSVVLEGTDEDDGSSSTSWRTSASAGTEDTEELPATGDGGGSNDVETSGGSEESTGQGGECAAPSSSAEVSALEELSDEFDDPTTFCAWRVRHEIEGTPSQIRSIDITQFEQGFLTVIPETSGWYGDFDGPFLYKEIEGDFIVEVSVTASSLADPAAPPTLPFSSAGLLIRDPASVPGAQSWVMWDLGRQIESLGAEAKTTRNSGSQLYIYDGYASGVLRICRRGEEVDLALRNPEDGTFDIMHSFARPDLPANLQVGVVTTAWNGTGSTPDFDVEPDLIGRWDYFRVRPIAASDDCLSE